MNVNCQDDETWSSFKYLFMRCKTVDEFLELWAKFYENQACLPNYFDNFININGCNPQASFSLGQKFKAITLKGVVCFDSQVTIPYQQKGYISAIAPNLVARELSKYLNRYNNIVAFNYDLTKFKVCNEGARDLYVTYDNEEILNEELHFTTGYPYTQAGLIENPIYYIKPWLNHHLRKIINESTYSYMVIINPSYDSDQEYVVDVLLEAVNTLIY